MSHSFSSNHTKLSGNKLHAPASSPLTELKEGLQEDQDHLHAGVNRQRAL
jgi:hypothetical protein